MDEVWKLSSSDSISKENYFWCPLHYIWESFKCVCLKRISYKRCIGRPRVVIISCSKGKKYVRKNIWIQRMPCNSTRSNSFETYVTLYKTRIKTMNVYDQNISNTSTMMIFHFNLKLLKSICYFDTDLSYSAFLILSWKWENM